MFFLWPIESTGTPCDGVWNAECRHPQTNTRKPIYDISPCLRTDILGRRLGGLFFYAKGKARSMSQGIPYPDAVVTFSRIYTRRLSNTNFRNLQSQHKNHMLQRLHKYPGTASSLW